MAVAEIGSYYISLIPTAHNLTGHIQKVLAPAGPLSSAAGNNAGGAFSHAFSGAIAGVSHAMVTAFKVGAGAAAAAVTAAGIVGVRTAAQLEQANIAFSTMFGDASKATSFIAELKAFASKTPFDFPGLVKSSQNLIAIGISADKVLPIMNTLGNVTSGMGTGAEGIKRATVALQQMNAAGKITAEDLNQLRDAGIPVYDLLTAATGKSKEEIAKMREEGKLGQAELDALMVALETGKGLERFNGLMEQQSQSMAGLWATLKDTFSMGMADVIGPLQPLIKDALGGSIQYITNVTPGAVAAMQQFVNSLYGAGGALDLVGDAWANVRYGFTGNEQLAREDVFNMPLVVAFGEALRRVADWVQGLDYSSFTAFFNSVTANIPGLQNLGDRLGKIGDLFVQLWPLVGAFMAELANQAPWLLGLALGAVTMALEFLVAAMPTLLNFMPLIVAGFIAWRLAALGTLAVKVALVAAIWGIQIAVWAWRGAVMAATAAQWLWNAAMGAHPIGLIIIAVAALVGALVWFFTQTELGRQIWTNAMAAIGAAMNWVWTSVLQPVFGFIGAAFAALWGWLVSWVVPVWNTIFQTVAGILTWFWQTVVVPVFNVITMVIGIAIALVVSILTGLWNFITGTLAPIFGWLWETIIQPAFAGIMTGVGFAVGVVTAILQGAWWFITNILAPVFGWLYENIVAPAFSAIMTIVAWAMTAVTLVLNAAFWLIQNVIGPVFLWLWQSIIAVAWAAISGIISFAWNVVIQPLLWLAWQFITFVFGAVFPWLLGVVVGVWTGIWDTVVWAWGLIFPILQGIWNFVTVTLGPVWNWLGDKIRDAWNVIKFVVETGWNWVRDHIFNPMFAFLKIDVPGVWDDAARFIGDAWNKIKEIAKTPIKWVITEVINKGIIDTFNGIADKLPGVNRLNHIRLPDGWARGGILPGYQAAKKDDTWYPMRSGEGVLVPEVVRGLGPGTIHAWNKAGNSGGVPAVKALASAQGFARGGLIRPAAGPITSGYRGARPDHDGVDIGAPMGAPVYAAGDGRVVDAGWHNWGGGNHIDLQHAGNLRTEYYHLSQVIAQVGQEVKKGQLIGRVGSTGNSTGPHLHYEVHLGDGLHTGDGVNPMAWLDGGGEFDPTGSMDGGGGGFNPFDGILSGMADLVKKAFPGGGAFVDAAVGTGMKVGQEIVSWIGSKFAGVFDAVKQGAGAVANKVQVTAWATEALTRTGNFSLGNLNSLMRRIQQESGGDPRAVNNWDSNAASGIPSKGIMQTIGPTFEKYRDRSLPNDIYDPVANIVAAIHYTKARYGDLRAGWDRAGGYGWGGIIPTLYDDGGLLHQGPQIIDHQRKAPDKVLTDSQWDAMYGIAEEANRPATIYVQNPFTAEYLIAETEQYAVDATGQAMQGSLVRARRGGKYATKVGRR